MVHDFLRKRGSGRLLASFLAAMSLGAAGSAVAQDSLSQASIQAQQAQAELQSRIDNADDATREALQRLRQASQQADRLESYNAELAPIVDNQAKRIASEQQALTQISVTREGLPGEMREMVEQLRAMIEADMPFLRDERLARVDDLEQMLSRDDASQADKLQRIFSVWRTELAYGREMDQWSGPLEGAQSDAASQGSQLAREVDYLRVGRTGWYYVTPDDRAGGVWSVANGEWEALDGDQIDEVRRGIRIAQDQSAPALLHLPASLVVEDGQSATEGQS
ncbi:DUF3450 domain-containing protein [Salinicola sp. LHM]|uniref:DUF3450 domain-containing protein n=1 Tax=Salinicola sp. LHM TaxID=3065298 RepID=UPI002ACEB45B|nr:DUF3450 domain-containing protein [Salinicola sp. LHM]WQH31558.1 DUF3450 domain-containing protein [Salinicola sp. LHM]